MLVVEFLCSTGTIKAKFGSNNDSHTLATILLQVEDHSMNSSDVGELAFMLAVTAVRRQSNTFADGVCCQHLLEKPGHL